MRSLRSSLAPCFALMPILLLALMAGSTARAQVAQAAVGGNQTISAGVLGSYLHTSYGDRKLLGVSAFVDIDLNPHYGIEGEGSWLRWHQRDNVHVDTYLIGPRYQFNYFHRLRPYAKFLIGDGEFNFPYNYAHGSYFAMAPGGGLDYRLSHRVSLRAINFEYQIWPSFTYGTLDNYSVSTGIRIRIF